MSEEYKIGFSTEESEARLSSLIGKLNSLAYAADKVDRRSVNPVTGGSIRNVDEMRRSLDGMFSRQLSQAQRLFAEHLERINHESSATSNAVDRLTASISRNRRVTRSAARDRSMVSSLHSSAQATAAWRAGLNAAGTSMGIFTSQTIAVASATYAAVSAFRASITAGIEFTDLMARVQAVTGASAETLDWMKQEVRSFAGETIFTAAEAADALLQLGMAGLSAEESVAAMPATLRLASIGLMSTGEAADLATNVMTQFGLEAKHLAAVVDDLATVANNSNTSVSQLGLALSYTGPAAASANVHITETVAAIGSLASAGIKGSRAGTAMRRVISMLVAPTEKAQKVLAKLGVSTKDLEGNARPLGDVLEDLSAAGVDYADAVDLVTLRQSQGLLALTSNTEKYRELEEQQHKNTGAAEKFQKTIEDTLGADFKLLVSAAYEQMLKFFDANEDGFRSMVQEATEFVKSLDVDKINAFLHNLKDGAITAAKALAGLWVTSKVFGLVSAVAALSSNLQHLGGVSGATRKGLSALMRVAARLHPALLALTVAGGGLAYAMYQTQRRTAAAASELERVTSLADKYRRTTEQLTKAQKESRYEALKQRENEIQSQLNVSFEEDATLNQLRPGYQNLVDAGHGDSEPARAIKALIDRRLVQIAEMKAKSAELSSELQEVQRELNEVGEAIGIPAKALKDHGNQYDLLTEKISKFVDKETTASEKVALYKKALDAANASVKDYSKELTAANDQVNREHQLKEKSIRVELEMHNRRLQNLQAYAAKEKEALAQRRANFNRFAGMSKAAYVGEGGSLTQAREAVISAELDRLFKSEQGLSAAGGEDYILDLYEERTKLEEEYAKLQEELSKKSADLRKDELTLAAELTSTELKLSDTRIQAIASYSKGLVSSRVLLERVTEANDKYVKSVKKANETFKPGSTAHSEALEQAKKEFDDDLYSAAGTAGERFAANLLDNLSGIGQSVADAVASGDYSGLRDALQAALSGAIGKSIGDAVTQSLGDNLGGLMGNVAGDSVKGMFGKAAGGILGGVAGGAVAGIVTGLMKGSKTEITGKGYRIGIEAGKIFSAELSTSFKKSSMFGSRRWTEYQNMRLAESDNLASSVAELNEQFTQGASSMGHAVNLWTGQLKNKNADISAALTELSEETAKAQMAALEKFQQVGETAAETYLDMVDRYQTIQEGFRVSGMDLGAASQGYIATESSRLADEYEKQYQDYLRTEKLITSHIASRVTTGDKFNEAAVEMYMGMLETMTPDELINSLEPGKARFIDGDNLASWLAYNDAKKRLKNEVYPVAEDAAEILKRMGDVYKEATENFNQELIGAIADVENLTTDEAEDRFGQLAASFAENYLSAQERLENTRKLTEFRLAQLDVGIGMDSSVEDVRAVIDSLKSSPADLGKAYLAAEYLKVYTDAVEDSANAVRELDTGPWDNLTKVVNREMEALNLLKDAAESSLSGIRVAIDAEMELNASRQEAVKEQVKLSEEAVNRLKSLYDKLDSALYGMSNLSEAQKYSQAQQELADALNLARTTGELPLDGEIDRALSVVQGVDSSAFSSAAQMAFEQAKTANQIQSLRDITGDQLSYEESALQAANAQLEALEAQSDRLDDVYSTAERQLRAALGTDQGVLSLGDALDKFADDLLALDEADYAEKMGYYEDSLEYYRKILETLQSGYTADTVAGAVSDVEAAAQAAVSDEDIIWRVNEIIGRFGGVTDEAAMEMYNTAKAFGVSLERLRPFLPEQDQLNMEGWLSGHSLPKFAAGGLHSGGFRLVGENGPEVEAVGPARYYSAGQTRQLLSGGADNGRIAEMADALKSVDSNTEQLRRDIRQWSVLGLPPTRQTV